VELCDARTSVRAGDRAHCSLVHQVHDGTVAGEGLLEDGLLQRSQACTAWGAALGREGVPREPTMCRCTDTATQTGQIPRQGRETAGLRHRARRTLPGEPVPPSHPWLVQVGTTGPVTRQQRPAGLNSVNAPMRSMATPVSRSALPSSPITRRSALAMPARRCWKVCANATILALAATRFVPSSSHTWDDAALVSAQAAGPIFRVYAAPQARPRRSLCGSCYMLIDAHHVAPIAACGVRPAVFCSSRHAGLAAPPRPPYATGMRPQAWMSPRPLFPSAPFAGLHVRHGVRRSPEQGLLRPGQGDRGVQVQAGWGPRFSMWKCGACLPSCCHARTPIAQEEDRIVVTEMGRLKTLLADRGLTGKRLKEYLIRLVYVEMLGHDASFGYMKAVEVSAMAASGCWSPIAVAHISAPPPPPPRPSPAIFAAVRLVQPAGEARRVHVRRPLLCPRQ